MRIEKILSAVDLGPDTERALAYALWLAQKTGDGAGSIAMLYVMDYALTPPAYLIPYMEEERIRSGEELRKWSEKLKGFGIKAEHKIASGRLVETFNAEINELGSDILVLGHKSHLIRPSSSERMIKSLQSPMLIVRGKKSEDASLNNVNIKRILCAVDFSDSSKKALECAAMLSEKSTAELIAVHCISSLKMEQIFQKCKNMSENEKNRCVEETTKDMEGQMTAFLRGYDIKEKIVKTGVPYEMINDAAEQRDADLIVMGARGLSYIKGVILGSVSESVIKSSPCPVMIVH
jgi:nucleotide-binding universal stress UspA family protein